MLLFCYCVVVVVVYSHSWADQLVPLLNSAQTKLSERISAHREFQPLQHKKLDPAAHLDPGPSGYDVYGGAGFSFQMVPDLLLDNSALVKRAEENAAAIAEQSNFKHQKMLMFCRNFLQRYAAGMRQQRASIGSAAVRASCTPTPDGDTRALGGSVLDRSHLPLVVRAYDKVIQILQDAKERDLTVQAMNELGDVMMVSGNIKYVGIITMM